MRAVNSLVIFVIFLIASTVVLQITKLSSESNQFSTWIISGVFCGFISAVIWLLMKKPKGTLLKLSEYFIKNLKVALGITVLATLFSMGFGLVDYGVKLKNASMQVLNWPSTSAAITGHDIHETPAGRTRIPRWSAIWAYEYEVKGKKFQSRSDSAPLGYSPNKKHNRSEAELDLTKRPLGSKVDTFYNPSTPYESVLDKAPAPGAFNLFQILGLTIIIIVSVGWYFISKVIRILS